MKSEINLKVEDDVTRRKVCIIINLAISMIVSYLIMIVSYLIIGYLIIGYLIVALWTQFVNK